jgi:two-component system sensor histidine kinase UhpB
VDVRRDGSAFDVEVRGARFMHQGTPAALAIVTDVTERRMVMKQRAQLSSRILMAQEEERARVSRDLHDGLGQMLTALRLELDWLGKRSKQDSASPGLDLTQATSLLDTSVQELRGICKGMRPPLLDDLGLEPALAQLIEEFEERASVRVDLAVDLGEQVELISSETALCVYRVVQEALTNAHRHAEASEVSVSLVCRGSLLVASIYDDGKGFDVAESGERGGFGLAGMRERARLVNGSLEVRSELRQGTRIELRIPLPTGAGKEEP